MEGQMAVSIDKAVYSALAQDGRITSRGIHITASYGNVILHGIVDSLEEFGLVQEAVERVPGVVQVENHLRIDGEVNTGPCCPQM
jgi:osmotically-inducible protein OsmY